VATWNIEIGAESADEMVAPILASAADVIAVVELTPEAAALLEADPRIRARFPSRALAPVPGSQGIGILSTVPISAPEVRMDHLGMHVTARTAAGRIEIVAVHPLPGETQFAGFLPALPVGYDTRDRDERVAAVRAWIEAVRAGRPDRPLVLLGDMNVTPSERPYAALAAGLLDAHREVGQGTGWSWRPASFARSPLALLRIDYVLTTSDLRPRATGSDCAVASDHCLLWADLGGPSRE
jgi:endonuclease/exonuclease/phosphatase family metal-dependent hydrolase